MLFEREQLPEFLKSTCLFDRFDDDLLSAIADRMAVLSLKTGTRVFATHVSSDELYIIFSGKVQLVREGIPDENPVELTSGDYFGQESLFNPPQPHPYSAVVTEPCILLGIKSAILHEMALDVPALREILTTLQQSFRKTSRTHPVWLNEGEYLAHMVRKHISILFSSLVLPVTLFFIFLLASLLLKDVVLIPGINISLWVLVLSILPVLWIIWLIFGWSNEYYVLTNQRILLLQKVLLFYETRQETPMEAVLSVTTETDLVGRWLTFGTVTVRTFTSSIRFPKVQAPEFFVSLFQHLLTRSRAEHETTETQAIETFIRNRLNQDSSQSEHETSPAPELTVTSRPSTFFESLIGMREVAPDSISYRTHWFILIKRTFLPFILGVGMVALIILRLSGYLINLPVEPVLIFACVATLILWGWWLYSFVDWRNDIYIITMEKVIDIDRKPLGSERLREAPLKNIQTIEYKRIGIWGLLLNFGTVFIHVGDTDLTFDFVSNPSEVQKELFERFMASVLHEKKANIESERQRMVDWMQAYQRVTAGTQEKNSGNPS